MTFDEELKEILDRHQNAYSIAFGEINPHVNYPDSPFDGTTAVMERSAEISKEATQAIKTLIKKHQPKRKQFETVDWGDGTFTEEVEGHDDWSNHMGKGYNQALADSDKAYGLDKDYSCEICGADPMTPN